MVKAAKDLRYPLGHNKIIFDSFWIFRDLYITKDTRKSQSLIDFSENDSSLQGADTTHMTLNFGFGYGFDGYDMPYSQTKKRRLPYKLRFESLGRLRSGVDTGRETAVLSNQKMPHAGADRRIFSIAFPFASSSISLSR